MKKLLLTVLLIPAILFSLPSQGQIYINFDGIEGDQAISADKGTELQSLTIGSSMTIALSTSTGGAGAGRAKFEEISFTKNRGKSSTAIQQKLYAGSNIPKVIINYYKSGSPLPFMVITLTQVFVTKIALALTAGETPSETISIAYTSIKIEDNYGAGTKPTSQWNAVTNSRQLP